MLSSILNELQQLNKNQPSNSFSFQKGKIFFGTVKELFSNDIALIKIGNQNLIAKLEVALTNGDAYWFQVDSDDGDIKLKLLSNQNPGSRNMSAILNHLALPSTKENNEIVSFLTKEQIPLTKESIIKISQWLTDNPDVKQNLNVVKLMLEKGFPLTESIYKSLIETENPKPIHNQLQLLEQQLKSEKQTPTVQEIQSTIQSIKNNHNEQAAFRVIQSLQEDSFSSNNVKQMLSRSILQKLDTDFDHQSQELVSSTQNEIKQSIVMPQREHEFINSHEFSRMQSVPQKMIDLTAKVIEKYFTQEIRDVDIPFTQIEKDYLKDILDTIKQSFNRKDALHLFRDVTKSLGIFYEAGVSNGMVETNHMEESLKPLLIKYLQESDHTNLTRDLAENLVYKMNGQQIQSYDNGPLQHVFYEIPIQLFGFKTNLSMQWSGNKKEDGKIDPNYCHILFYLDLEHLNQTIVEMKVQNRVITVNVFNESAAIKETSSQLIPILKNGLEELNYHLSAIHFIDKDPSPKITRKENINAVNRPYTGLDIRV